jgi:hypothetical protein
MAKLADAADLKPSTASHISVYVLVNKKFIDMISKRR